MLPNGNSGSAQNSPLPSPVSGANQSNPSSMGDDNSRKGKPNDPQLTNISSKSNPKGLNHDNNTSSKNQPTDKQTDEGKTRVEKVKVDNATDTELGTTRSCKGSTKTCSDLGTLLACIQTNESGSEKLVLLIQNEGESTLKVNLTTLASVDNTLPAFELREHQTRKINISLTMGGSTKVVLNAGNGDCVLHMDPSNSEGNFFQRLSFYSKLVTPIYGAYFLLLVTLIFGGTWACCKFRKRRQQGGVQYQELEMGLPQSASAVNVEPTEGWDQDWDDDWDEGNAVRSPGGHHVGSISANGLTSRSSRKDGWEYDWND